MTEGFLFRREHRPPPRPRDLALVEMLLIWAALSAGGWALVWWIAIAVWRAAR